MRDSSMRRADFAVQLSESTLLDAATNALGLDEESTAAALLAAKRLVVLQRAAQASVVQLLLSSIAQQARQFELFALETIEPLATLSAAPSYQELAAVRANYLQRLDDVKIRKAASIDETLTLSTTFDDARHGAQLAALRKSGAASFPLVMREDSAYHDVQLLDARAFVLFAVPCTAGNATTAAFGVIPTSVRVTLVKGPLSTFLDASGAQVCVASLYLYGCLFVGFFFIEALFSLSL